MTKIFCVAMPANKHEPKRLICLDEQKECICSIYCDGIIEFNARRINAEELRQLAVIQENFFLMYDNIYRTT
jgi:hypothetical protein